MSSSLHAHAGRTSVRLTFAVLALCTAAGAGLSAQLPRLTASDFAALRSRAMAADAAPGAEEWVVRLPDAAGATAQPATPAPALPLVNRVSLPNPIARERDPQLAADRLVVIGEASDGSVVDWRIVADPRVIRSEQPDSTGLLSGRTLQMTGVNLHVTLAAVPSLSVIRIYRPRWNGDSFDLELLGSAEVRR